MIDLRILDEGKELPNPLVAPELASGGEMDSASTILETESFHPGQ